MAEAGRLALQTFRSISFSKRIRRACPVQLPKVPALGLARDWIGFEPIFSALEYAGESGAPGRIRTDTLPGLSRFSLRWNTGAKDPPSGRAPDYFRYHGMRRFLTL